MKLTQFRILNLKRPKIVYFQKPEGSYEKLEILTNNLLANLSVSERSVQVRLGWETF